MHAGLLADLVLLAAIVGVLIVVRQRLVRREPPVPAGPTLYPRRRTSIVALLGAVVVLGVLGLGKYLATAADILLWVLVAAGVITVARWLLRRPR